MLRLTCFPNQGITEVDLALVRNPLGTHKKQTGDITLDVNHLVGAGPQPEALNRQQEVMSRNGRKTQTEKAQRM